MTKVSQIYSEKPVSAAVNEAMNQLSSALAVAIAEAKDAGVPQGLVVALLAGQFHEETQRMLNIRDQQ